MAGVLMEYEVSLQFICIFSIFVNIAFLQLPTGHFLKDGPNINIVLIIHPPFEPISALFTITGL